MIISWEKIRHQHPKEEWKRLLNRVECGSSHIFTEKRFWCNSAEGEFVPSNFISSKADRKKSK
ncbi:LIC12628 family protein [Leptospira noguchii]|uniref:Uncharacterized protein n=4 Tax=Leptospira noguchii TaxID=28182 RepID=M6YI10_9LEPT|nr:hypothetical protein [Leptospira noguchii]EMO28757.1 hypothetical protein LEP1GSC170_3128 [Leptospira interrogans serovar Bataviae str. HAI135]EKR72138.1 hypothetical protein LEP1GSC041_2448 [Leptospira noguchii str. 2006001870]EMI71332.1 hypothetical protein LEP1GSC072_0379 [Leptospira noguchii str. Bonito]EMM98192.1 hypothetical protein LEP1GSC035_0404 [Leptospira noguchii str. 2007001578]EMO39316.1 hypothetical protein LEP1GSC186_1282 [Leptospira noguchii serovar Autumnalis str. ZUN142]